MATNATSVTMEEGGRITEPRAPPSGLMKFMDIVNLITHLSLGAVATGGIFTANLVRTNARFGQHIYLCVFGYVILMSHAVLSISSLGWARSFKPKEKRIIHWVMQVVGSALAIAGSIIGIVFADNHFATAHGSLGIIAFIFTILSFIGGVLHLFASNISLNTSLTRIMHSCSGILTLVVAFISLIFAFNGTFRYLISYRNADMYIVFTVFALFGTILSASMSTVRIIIKC